MAKRGPGRPKYVVAIDDTMGILNGEIPPRITVTSSPRKRKRETENGSSPTTKRRATVGFAGEVLKPGKSTRLSHPQVSTTQQRRSGDAGRKQGREIYEVPLAHSPQSARAARAWRRADKAGQVQDENNHASDVEEGKEDAADPLLASPSVMMRTHAKRKEESGQVRAGENPVVEVQTVRRGHRPQRLLTNGTKARSNALLKPQAAPVRATQKPSARQHATEVQATLAAGRPERKDVLERDHGSTHVMPQEHRDQPIPAKGHRNSVENPSNGGQDVERGQPSGTREACERAFDLYNCKKSWKIMLEAAQDNLDDDSQGHQASEITALLGFIQSAKAAYYDIKKGYKGNVDDREFKLKDHLMDIDQKISTLRATTNKKANARLIKDIYLQGIPRMVKLLKMVILTRSQSGKLSIASLKELNRVIDATLSLCDRAYRWQPRPVIENGVKKRTKNVIKVSLDALRRAYTEAQHAPPDEEEEQAQKAAKRQALADHVTNFLATKEEKRMRVEQNMRGTHRDRRRRSTDRVGPMTDVFDIDDLSVNNASPAPAMDGMRKSLPWRETGVMAARQSLSSNISPSLATEDVARRSRESTEDIPAPMAPSWSKEENLALIHGLELFTDANRYLEIDRMFGAGSGPLSGRDVDQLMQRAKFYKHTMASKIEEDRKRLGNVDRWAFLLSVEG